MQFAFSSNSTGMEPGSSNPLDTDSMGTADSNSTGVEAGSNPARRADPQTQGSNSSGIISDPISKSGLIDPDDTIRPEPPNPAPPSTSPSPSAQLLCQLPQLRHLLAQLLSRSFAGSCCIFSCCQAHHVIVQCIKPCSAWVVTRSPTPHVTFQ